MRRLRPVPDREHHRAATASRRRRATGTPTLVGRGEAALVRAATIQGDPRVTAAAAGPVQVTLGGPPEWRHDDRADLLAQGTRRPRSAFDFAVRCRPGPEVAHVKTVNYHISFRYSAKRDRSTMPAFLRRTLCGRNDPCSRLWRNGQGRQIVRLKITKRLSGSIDGLHIGRFRVGEVYEIGTSLANYLLAIDAAEPVSDAEPADAFRVTGDHLADAPGNRYHPDLHWSSRVGGHERGSEK
jgi:hypothetical protein